MKEKKPQIQPVETPEEAWEAILSFPAKDRIWVLSQDQAWKSILPHIAPDPKIRSAFETTFFSDAAIEKRARSIHGAVPLRQTKARNLFIVASLNQQPDQSETKDTQLWVGSVIMKAITDGDDQLFKNLASIINNGGLEEHNSPSYDRWVLFCEFILDNQSLPTKKETRDLWESFGLLQVLGQKQKRFVSEKKANQWRHELGLGGLPS